MLTTVQILSFECKKFTPGHTPKEIFRYCTVGIIDLRSNSPESLLVDTYTMIRDVFIRK